MLLVLDNARYHHARLLAPTSCVVMPDNLRLLFLPPYSPQLGPDRASLEADSAPRDSQPLLRHAGRGAQGGQRLLRPVASSQTRYCIDYAALLKSLCLAGLRTVYQAELGSFHDERAAKHRRSELRSRFSGVLEEVDVVSPDSSNKRYRVMSGIMDLHDADSTCASLKRDHQTCEVVSANQGQS